jgi:hypothetical protein
MVRLLLRACLMRWPQLIARHRHVQRRFHN